MRYFTSNPLERLMMQAPPPQRERSPQPDPPKGHPCHGCKRCGERCVLPCYRGGGDSAHCRAGSCPIPVSYHTVLNIVKQSMFLHGPKLPGPRNHQKYIVFSSLG